jgi:hypothetical protein
VQGKNSHVLRGNQDGQGRPSPPHGSGFDIFLYQIDCCLAGSHDGGRAKNRLPWEMLRRHRPTLPYTRGKTAQQLLMAEAI